MTSQDFPVVEVWEAAGDQWASQGEVDAFEELNFTPSYNLIGDWSLTMDYTDQATLLERDRLTLISFRGQQSTWTVVPHPSSDETTGQSVLEAAGVGAMALLGWELAWPDPTKDLNSQPVVAETDPAPYKGPAETVIKQLVAQNLRDRRGMDIVVPPSLGRGAVVTARPVFDNLLELVTNLANLGGIGVDVGLVRVGGPGSTRAALTLLTYVPEDKTKDVLLTADAGAIDKWDQVETEPTMTLAIVAGGGTGGVDRIRRVVTTPDSVAAATAWGGHRVGFVDGPSSFDPDELDQAGKQALLEGAATRTLALTAAESEGQMAFRDFNRGDRATGEVITGASVQDVITSIPVTVDADGITIGATFGNPARTDVETDLTDQIGALIKAVRRQQRK